MYLPQQNNYLNLSNQYSIERTPSHKNYLEDWIICEDILEDSACITDDDDACCADIDTAVDVDDVAAIAATC